MTITSIIFVLFIFGVLLLYYIIPKRFQWILLLFASAGFYLSFGLDSALYIVVTATSIYGATRWMERLREKKTIYLKENKANLSRDDKKAYKNKIQNQCKTILSITLILNFGILCFFKYFHFALEQYNTLMGIFNGKLIVDTFSFIIPLGISFYTFQATGYLIDVYWEKCNTEKNYLKVLLFISFFPQITQGPISDFEQLSGELFKEHRFSYKNYSWGFQRMLWGFTKKMILANTLAPWVTNVFENYSAYSGSTCLIGAFLYSIQIYADFSGYMDIMCGYCEMLDIRLSENFERPYFSKSIAEYWRRWHITLGAWFKKYIYYPIAVAKWNRNLAKKSKTIFGEHFGKSLSASIALVVVWLATGLWHGATWAYIVWGLINGLFIIISIWMEPVYSTCKSTLKINESAWLWRAFQVVRTFFLVTLIKILPEVGTLPEGLGLWKQIFTGGIGNLSKANLFPYIDSGLKCLAVICVTILFLIISLLQRKEAFRIRFNKIPMVLRVLILAALTILIFAIGISASGQTGGFLYERF